jgi:tRNA-binding protein
VDAWSSDTDVRSTVKAHGPPLATVPRYSSAFVGRRDAVDPVRRPGERVKSPRPDPPDMGIDEPDIDPSRFLEDVEMRVGTVTSAEPFPEARKDLYRLTVDFGTETRQSAAGLTERYDPAELVGSQVVAVVNLGTVTVAGFDSECLVTGVDGGDGGVIHLTTERGVPDGTRVY